MKYTILSVMLIALFCSSAVADDHKKEKNKNIAPVTNELYRSSCGGCHFAYQPGLMPKRSWINMLDNKGAHPGGELKLDKSAKAKIKDYLVQESADNSASERSRKIVASLSGSETPVHISEIPYIQKKHRKINKGTFKRPSIGSAGNCKACHKSAEQGIYEDDDVVIPSK
jgi:Dihaem cytochrome c